jgi:hypothetical protein
MNGRLAVIPEALPGPAATTAPALVGAAVIGAGATPLSMWLPIPIGDYPPIYYWDEERVHEDMSDRQVTKWDVAPASKLSVYEWDG